MVLRLRKGARGGGEKVVTHNRGELGQASKLATLVSHHQLQVREDLDSARPRKN
jgi:hypothetical protein